tara:strand:- start:9226 stop:9741 length:516 start_codon:yes stop_codon:yes gene_type:complete
MKIKHVKGDLLKFPEGINYICQSCNGENVMGGGIAKQIKAEIPEMFRADTKHPTPIGEERLGEFSAAGFKRNGVKRVGFNVYGQLLSELSPSGIPTNYKALMRGLMGVKQALKNNYAKRSLWQLKQPDIIIGIPWLMGSGLGGGDFEVVQTIIECVFHDLECTIVYVEWAG